MAETKPKMSIVKRISVYAFSILIVAIVIGVLNHSSYKTEYQEPSASGYDYVKCQDEYDNQEEKESALLRFIDEAKKNNPDITPERLSLYFRVLLELQGCPLVTTILDTAE